MRQRVSTMYLLYFRYAAKAELMSYRARTTQLLSSIDKQLAESLVLCTCRFSILS